MITENNVKSKISKVEVLNFTILQILSGCYFKYHVYSHFYFVDT